MSSENTLSKDEMLNTEYDETQADSSKSATGKFSDEIKEHIAHNFVKDDEKVVGYGQGGSESLTIFLEDQEGKKFVRKILNEKFITPNWDASGKDVMLPPCSKAKSQAMYLMGLEDSAKPYFPLVLSAYDQEKMTDGDKYNEYIYDMTFVEGIEVSKFVRDYNPSTRVVAMLYSEIFKVLKTKIHNQRQTKLNIPTLEQSYFTKIEKRLELCKKTSPITFGDALQDSDHIYIDGKLQRNVKQILGILRSNSAYRSILEPNFHSLVMGDTNTENIKIGNIEPLLNIDPNCSFYEYPFDANSLQLKFLDPRAIGFHIDGEDSGRDDPMYDNKPWHNSIGNYDDIHGEHFDIAYENRNGIPAIDINFHKDSPYHKPYEGIDRYFNIVMGLAWELDDPDASWAKQDPHWLVRFVFVMGSHFMAMPPFHFEKDEDGVFVDTVEYQKRAMAIYAEGIRWLNKAIDILEGRIDSYLGVHIGDKYRSENIDALVNEIKKEKESLLA